MAVGHTRPVWLADGAYVCTADHQFDVHNDYDVRAVEVDWGQAILRLSFVRATGSWVGEGLPRELRLTLSLLRDCVVTGWTDDEWHRKDIDVIGYTSWASSLTDREYWFSECEEADALAVEFGDGSYLRARADRWDLEVLEQR